MALSVVLPWSRWRQNDLQVSHRFSNLHLTYVIQSTLWETSIRREASNHLICLCKGNSTDIRVVVAIEHRDGSGPTFSYTGQDGKVYQRYYTRLDQLECVPRLPLLYTAS